MAGHNKWSQIKRQKEKTDAYRSKVFSKFASMITLEAKKSGGNLDSPGLKAAIEKAKKANMPNDNIKRAIDRIKSEKNLVLEPLIYECYGPGGVAIIIETMTSNRNKSAQEIKHILSKHGSDLAGIGSVTWAFERNEDSWIPKTTIELDDESIEKLNSLVQDLEANDDVQDVHTNAG